MQPMEFGEKLQELRKQKNMTQEELAKELFVSRAAVSKWESNRGYPGIDSLKEISRYFHISIDDLLSGEELLVAAESDSETKLKAAGSRIAGILDLGMLLLLFGPFFGQTKDGGIQAVSLLGLTECQGYRKAAYLILTAGLIVCGIVTLLLREQMVDGEKTAMRVSLGLGILSTLVFMASMQPYAAMFSFFFLMIKILLFFNPEMKKSD